MFHSCLPVMDFACTLPVINYSDFTVYVCASCSDSLERGRNLQLYKYSFDGKEIVGYPNYRIEKDSIGYVIFREKKVEHAIKRCKDHKLRLFFISESTMRNYSWEEICKHNLYEKKLTLTEEELKENDWIVVYE